jgi:hypothetical protein
MPMTSIQTGPGSRSVTGTTPIARTASEVAADPHYCNSSTELRVIARAASSPSQWDAVGASLGSFGTLDPRPRRLQMFA